MSWSSKLTVAALGAALLTPLSAGVITQLANDSTLTTDQMDWATLGGDMTALAPPVNALTTGGRALTVGGPASLTVFDGSTYNADFLAGDFVISAFDLANGNPLPDAIRLDFAAPIRAAGAQIQVSEFGAFVGTMRAFGAGNVLFGSVTVNGSVAGAGDGSAPFIGLTSSLTDILALEFVGNKDAVAINRVKLLIPRDEQPPEVPEPSTYALLGAGLGLLAILRRR